MLSVHNKSFGYGYIKNQAVLIQLDGNTKSALGSVMWNYALEEGKRAGSYLYEENFISDFDKEMVGSFCSGIALLLSPGTVDDMYKHTFI